MYEWVERNMLTRGCVKIFFTLVHWTNTDKLKKRKKKMIFESSLLFISQIDFLLWGTATHSLIAYVQIGTVVYLTPHQRREGKIVWFWSIVQYHKSSNYTKWEKKSMGFWGPLTSSCLVRGLNHRKRAEPRAGRSCASRSKEITTILVITWVLVFPWMCSFRT